MLKKLKMPLLFLLVCLLCPSILQAQDSDFKKKLFTEKRFTLFFEGGVSPKVTTSLGSETSFSYITFLGYDIEPRYNILTFSDKAAFALSVPLSGRLLVDLGGDVTESGFLPTLGSGIFANFNTGFKSTHNNIDPHGHGFSAGVTLEKMFASDIEGLVLSPMVRYRGIILMNSVRNYYFGYMLKAGIPGAYTNADNQEVKTNLFGGISLLMKL